VRISFISILCGGWGVIGYHPISSKGEIPKNYRNIDLN